MDYGKSGKRLLLASEIIGGILIVPPWTRPLGVFICITGSLIALTFFAIDKYAEWWYKSNIKI